MARLIKNTGLTPIKHGDLDIPKGAIRMLSDSQYDQLTTTDLTLVTEEALAAAVGFKLGTVGEGATVKGIYSATVAVTVPAITDPDCAKVDVDVSAAFTIQPAVGDLVIAQPIVALPTNCRLGGAWITATDTVQITYSSEGGNVVSAAKNHNITIIKLV